MIAKTFVLTNSPYTKSQIALASFVPNVKQPHQDTERPYQVKDTDYTIQPDSAFNFIISNASESHLRVLATRLLSLSASLNKEDTLQVTAEKGYIYSINDPKKLFNKIVFDDEESEEIQRWLEDCKQSGIKPRFVVGYRTFIDGHLTVGAERGRSAGAGVNIPSGTVMGDVTGIGDVDVSIGYSNARQTSGAMTTLDERIYAICYRKVKLAQRKGKGLALLDSDNVWESFAASTRGDEEDEEDGALYIEADLQAEEEDKAETKSGCEAFSIQRGPDGGESEVFAVLRDDTNEAKGESKD
ncbi:hypothetical protein H9Q69_000423 [Fusarium xylarioides]|nr:hypothetical protein H9Q70_009874 [Fusarium xylarioides]KAG5774727.1 hypothetical protein H9Q73_011594 [Fusarium xylarioides]KAG5800536.1 hypothetical protein H9Q69_000423 [Fusarium xylarioides]